MPKAFIIHHSRRKFPARPNGLAGQAKLRKEQGRIRFVEGETE